ncbi:unnamed protein product [Candida verbasci]|uniref:Uncharacterized protein n=1 Tax=Candida verbasci TaxID=1227364 RepID=A0A9W4TRT1_9ASCO|nr:unnamed protein product [Candida verbasci]
MGFQFEDSGIAASIYLALYTIYLIATIKIVYDKGWRSIYTSLLIFGIFRVCGQLCGVAFAKLGYKHYQWLIAYLVFSAEGYFTLILTSFHLIAHAQIQTSGSSWIRPTKKQKKQMIRDAKTWREQLQAKIPITTIFHWLLIPANAFIIAGGSMLTGQTPGNMDQNVVHTSKALRTTGQIIFLLQTCIAIGLAVFVYAFQNLRHSNIYSIFLTSPFILVRGIFGILSIYLTKMNYYDMSNYTENGLNPHFVIYEYVLATTMEFITGVIYISNYYFDKKYSRRCTDDQLSIISDEKEDENDTVSPIEKMETHSKA